MTEFVVVIPARHASERLPGKPLLDIAGKPMIRHTWERARESGAERVVIATDDERIATAAREFDAEVVMTSSNHASGTDRINEAATTLGLPDDAVVVNLQGDEPLMPAANIRQVAELVARADTDIATLGVQIRSAEEFRNPNVVKVVADDEGRALYFSRAPIPFDRDGSSDGPGSPQALDAARRHLGLYAYKVGALRRFAEAEPAKLEQVEKLEQLRAMALGQVIRIATAETSPPPGVDTDADLEHAREMLADQGRQ